MNLLVGPDLIFYNPHSAELWYVMHGMSFKTPKEIPMKLKGPH